MQRGREYLNRFYFFVCAESVTIGTQADELTHAEKALGEQRCDLWFSLNKLAKQVGGVFKPKGIAKVLHNAGGEVIGDDGRYLDFRVRPKLPACPDISRHS